MDPMAFVVDNLKAIVKSGEAFIAGRRDNKSRHNPIEILKRLQREAFSDLMKLRDRQDKLEKMVTFFRTSKGGPFQEDGTRVSGDVNVMGGLFLVNDLDHLNLEALKRAGMITGIDARIRFESRVRQKDVLEAEFVSGQSSGENSSESLGTTLSLGKVCYTANLTDWLSIVASPMGARCRDIALSSDSSFQEKGLSDFSTIGPPLLHQNLGCAIGLTVKKSNVVASLAQFVIDFPSSFERCFSTFGQIVCQLPKNSKLCLFGLHQVPKSRLQDSQGRVTMPLGIFRCHKFPQAQMEPSSETICEEKTPTGSIGVMLESELDDSARVQGWMQMRNTSPKHLQWAVSMMDSPEDEIGWGLSLGGDIHGSGSWDHFQVEAFLKINLANRLTLQPGFVYLMDGNRQLPAFMVRSSWCL